MGPKSSDDYLLPDGRKVSRQDYTARVERSPMASAEARRARYAAELNEPFQLGIIEGRRRADAEWRERLRKVLGDVAPGDVAGDESE
jgi:hypothetical protein